jgi:threonine dehydratase
MNLPTFSDIEKAHDRIRQLIHHTPVLTSKSINQIVCAELSELVA